MQYRFIIAYATTALLSTYQSHISVLALTFTEWQLRRYAQAMLLFLEDTTARYVLQVAYIADPDL